MREENIKNLIDKYKLGTSSLKEEQFLFDNVDKTDIGIEASSVFVKMNKKEIPDSFNDKLWDSFEEKTIKNSHFRYHFLAVAASILLIVTLYISNLRESKLNYTDKVALLKEAQNMFLISEETLPIENIIIESDLVVVYTKTE
ncbi:hypothetical protein SHK09_11285 [Polaribacter sp. PL03]|uniref:hypothetical protein n=1 Tax=Polaribacter sp. PL03 TaxID=3088353 RepID=UPI0029D017FC|nr:hypothetical protein [Polaribacter sp. PL03]MDX6747377.1 hypothetical protein [Polaribacter sp. PL03]